MSAWRWLAPSVAAAAIFLAATPAPPAETRTVTLKVEGMACPFCALTVESVLKRAEGVLSADASFIRGEAVVRYDPAKTSPEALVRAINSATFYRASSPREKPGDFRAGARQLLLRFDKPFDPRRTWNIGMALKGVKGVAAVNALPDGRVRVTFDPRVVPEKEILSRVEGLGYPVRGAEATPPPEGRGGEGGASLPLWALGGALLAALGLFVYFRRRRAGWPRRASTP